MAVFHNIALFFCGLYPYKEVSMDVSVVLQSSVLPNQIIYDDVSLCFPSEHAVKLLFPVFLGFCLEIRGSY